MMDKKMSADGFIEKMIISQMMPDPMLAVNEVKFEYHERWHRIYHLILKKIINYYPKVIALIYSG